jgi:hypothetical protein
MSHLDSPHDNLKNQKAEKTSASGRRKIINKFMKSIIPGGTTTAIASFLEISQGSIDHTITAKNKRRRRYPSLYEEKSPTSLVS